MVVSNTNCVTRKARPKSAFRNSTPLATSAAALAVARGNAERLGFARRAAFAPGDWSEGLRERFDVIFCNPPYVETAADLSPEVRREPASALFAGADGLDDYKRIVPQLPGLLRDGGVALLEIGHTQAAAVLALAQDAGLDGIVRHDLAGRDRCLVLKMNAPSRSSSP